MAKVTFDLDPIANTMNIWWGSKKRAHKAIEVKNPNRDDVIIVDKKGTPISLEIIGFFPEELDPVQYLDKKRIKQLLHTGSVDLKQTKLLS